MQVQTLGGSRPKLTLAYGAKTPGQAPAERRSPTLSARELRRIVADLID
ncbi:MAG TPA: hypothetical protein VGD10_10200 [Allosphingosinicella sp.]